MLKVNSIAESVRKTLAYFGLFFHPLTVDELYKFLWCPPAGLTRDYFLWSLRATFQTARDAAAPWLEEKNGFYFLPGRGDSVEIRRRHGLHSDLKMKIARRAAKKIRSVPFLRAVFVCNSVAAGQATLDSDIDFFIVAAPGRIWIARFFCNLILRLWGLRTYGDNLCNRVCLSFFVDEDNLNLENFQAVEDDVHFIYWLHQMIPLYDFGGIGHQFFIKNVWTKKYLSNVSEKFNARYINQVSNSIVGKIWKRFLERMLAGVFGDLIEKQARDLQMRIMPLSIRESAGKNNDIVISASMIKLHGNDTRLKIKTEWNMVI